MRRTSLQVIQFHNNWARTTGAAVAPISMKTFSIVLLAVLSLAGCVAVPYDAGYYGPSVVVQPYGYRGGYRGGYHGGRRSHW
jgi:hypothetical protein